MHRDATAFEVREALGRPGCPVCRLALRAVRRFIRSVAYEQVNDPELRAELRAARGFCNPHAYRWLREAHNVLGTALIYRDVVQAALKDELAASGSAAGGGRKGLLGALLRRGEAAGSGPRARAACPACQAQRQAEHRYLAALWAILADPDDRALFEVGEGVCLVHALELVRGGGARAESVLAHTRRQVERLLATLTR